jgi:hypothetical protein
VAGTVTATGGGTIIQPGILLRIWVLLLASDQQTGATASSQAAYQVSITPGQTNSRIYGALCDDSSFTANASTTLVDNLAGGTGTRLGSCKATALSVATVAKTVGASAPSWLDGGVALYEVRTAISSGPVEDGSAPAAATSTTLHVISSASFTPPPTALLVAAVSHFGGSNTMTDTFGPGGAALLSWQKKVEITTDGYAGIWIAQVPGLVPRQLQRRGMPRRATAAGLNRAVYR